MGKYHYRIDTTSGSSEQYGKCEVCGKHASEVFVQQESREYTRPDGTEGLTQAYCKMLFGHENCLTASRR